MLLMTRLDKSDRGAVMVFFALFAPVIVALGVFTIDVSNWFEHQRYLQVRADAGALAAAQAFQPCDPTAIYETAAQYSGSPSASTPGGAISVPLTWRLYNTKVGALTQANIQELINSKTFYNQGSTKNPQTPDDTTASDPCTTPAGQIPMVDVKLTETNLPWYFSPFKSVPFINAQARVEILRENVANNAEALAVADSAPLAARAYFVNEDVAPLTAGWVLYSSPLCKEVAQNGGLDVWDNSGSKIYADKTCAASPLPVQILNSTPHVGVVIALSGDASDTTCGDPYVQCFDDTTGTKATGPSLLHIQTYANGGTGTLAKPLARSVTLSATGSAPCDGYFVTPTSACTETISAWTDYGTTNTSGVTVKPVVNGTTENALAPAGTSGTAIDWQGTITLHGAGSNQIDLNVSCAAAGTSTACTSNTSKTLTDVQRAYAAGASSGTISGAWVSEGLANDANSFEVCEPADNNSCTHNLTVTVDVAGSLQNSQSYADAPYAIRVGTSQGNVVGCGANASPSGAAFRTNLAAGCTGPFKLNTSDPTCANATVSPYDCVVLASGVKNGPFGQGIYDRIKGSPPAGTQYYCRNNWQNNNNNGVPIIPNNDSRLINLFVMPYGATDANGNPILTSGYVPIQNFATFYVTGWGQQGGTGDPCGSDDKAPANAGNAWIEGHFIQYIGPPGFGSGSGACALTSFGTCIAQLTR
jgi:hypothetical protein